jgi:serine/threonine protein kinase
VVHGDISPQNILFYEPNKIKIADFGSASVGLFSSNTPFSGNPNYLSPEKAWLSPYDERTDIFSTAAILYEYLSHKPLFNSQYDSAYFDNHKLSEKLETISCSVNPHIKFVLRKALSPSKKLRYSSAFEFKRELLEIFPI